MINDEMNKIGNSENEIGQTEQLINFLSERLEKAIKENVLLKAQKRFTINNAEYTMKRLTEDIGSYVVKEIIRK
jgi:hypothetical protein